MTGTRKHYNDGFEGPPLEAGITWGPGEGQSIDAGTGETEGLDAQRESDGALQAQAPEHLLSPSIPTTIGERQAIAEANIVDEARTLIVTMIRDAARQYAPTDNGKGSYEYLAGMATKVEQAEAVAIDSYLALDCVISALRQTLPIHGEMREALERREPHRMSDEARRKIRSIARRNGPMFD